MASNKYDVSLFGDVDTNELAGMVAEIVAGGVEKITDEKVNVIKFSESKQKELARQISHLVQKTYAQAISKAEKELDKDFLYTVLNDEVSSYFSRSKPSSRNKTGKGTVRFSEKDMPPALSIKASLEDFQNIEKLTENIYKNIQKLNNDGLSNLLTTVSKFQKGLISGMQGSLDIGDNATIHRDIQEATLGEWDKIFRSNEALLKEEIQQYRHNLANIFKRMDISGLKGFGDLETEIKNNAENKDSIAKSIFDKDVLDEKYRGVLNAIEIAKKIAKAKEALSLELTESTGKETKIPLDALEESLLQPLTTKEKGRVESKDLSKYSAYGNLIERIQTDIKENFKKYQALIDTVSKEGITEQDSEAINTYAKRIYDLNEQVYQLYNSIKGDKFLKSKMSHGRSSDSVDKLLKFFDDTFGDYRKNILQNVRDEYEKIGNYQIPDFIAKQSSSVNAVKKEQFEKKALEWEEIVKIIENMNKLNSQIAYSSNNFIGTNEAKTELKKNIYNLIDIFYGIEKDLSTIDANETEKQAEKISHLYQVWMTLNKSMASLNRGGKYKATVAKQEFKFPQDLKTAFPFAFPDTKKNATSESKATKPKTPVKEAAETEAKAAEELSKSNEKVAKEVEKTKKNNEKVKEVTGDIKKMSLSEIKSEVDTLTQGGANGSNLQEIIKYIQELQRRISSTDKVTQDLIDSLKALVEIKKGLGHKSTTQDFNIGGQSTINGFVTSKLPLDDLQSIIAYLEGNMGMQFGNKAKTKRVRKKETDTSTQTEIGETADKVTKDTEKLEQATQKAEQVVQKAEEVQAKAKRTRTKKTTTDDTTSGTSDGAGGTGGASIPITPTISREALQQALSEMSEGQPFSVKIGAVNADTGVDVTNLVDKINETLKTVPVIVYLVHGSNPIDISNLVDRINETFKETPVTVSVVNGATELKVDELKTTIETKLTETPPKIAVISAIEDINIADVINAINNKLKTAQVVVENVTGSEQMNTDTLRQYLKNSLQDAVVEIHNVVMSEDLNAETLANGITDKLKGQTVKVENIQGDVKEGDSNLATYISGKLKGQPVYVDTIRAAEPLNIEDLVTKIQTSLTNQPFTVKTIQADTSLDISKLVGAIETAVGTQPHKINVDVSEAQANITNLINSINEVKPLMTVSGKLSIDTEAAILRIDEFKQRINDAKEELTKVGKINFKPLEDNLDPVNQKLIALKETLKPYTQEQHFMLPSFGYDTDQNQQLENYSKHLDAIQEKISQIVSSTTSLQRTGKKISLPDIRVPVNTDTIVKMISYEQSIKSLATALNELKAALEGIKGYQDVIKDVNSLIPKRTKVKKVTAKKKEDNDKSSAEKKKDSQTAVTEAKSEIEQAYKEVGETAKKAAEKAVKDAKDVEMDKILKDILQGTKKTQAQRAVSGNVLGDENKEVIRKALTEYDDIVEKIKSKSYNVEKSGEEWRRAQKILQDAMDNTGDTRRAEKYLLKLENLSSKIGNLMANNSKVKGTSVGNQLENLASEINVLKQIQPNSEDVQRVTKEYERLRSLMYETGTSGKGELQKIAATISATFRRVFAGDVTYRLLMKIREVPRVVREIDSAMTDLKRVTTETGDAYDKFLTSAISKSKQLGATVTETIKATSSFGRLGYELNDAAQLAESALIYKNVGWLDIETATNDLVSAMKAFNIEAEDSLRIVDIFNILGNKFALTSADVGTGLKQSASALAVANNSFEESAAMITAITEITQDASSAGNALKTLSLRIRSTKAELSEMGEDAEGAATTTAKLRKQIKGITGVDILKNNNEFKSTYEIMQGIAKVWKDLSDTEQASVLESLAGKVRANQVAALLNNWSQAEKALDESLNSSGTALKENDVYLKSAEGRLSQLKATAQDLALDVFNSDELKAFLKEATKLLDLFTKLKDIVAPVLAGFAVAGTTIKNPSEGVGVRAVRLFSGKSQASILKDAGLANKGNFDFSSIKSYMDMSQYTIGSQDWNRELQGYVKNMNLLTDVQQRALAQKYELVAAGKVEKITLQELGVSTAAQTAKTIAWSVAQTTLNAVVGVGIGLIVQGLISGITELIQANEKATQKALDLADVTKQENDEIDDYKTKITELKTALDDANLTQKEAYEKRKELIGIQDEIIDKYDLEKNKVDLLNGSLEQNIKLLDEQAKANLRTNYNEQKSTITEAEKRLSTERAYEGKWFGTNASYKNVNNLDTIEEILNKYGFRVTEQDGKIVVLTTKSTFEMYEDLGKVIEEFSNNKDFEGNPHVEEFINIASKARENINTEQFKNDKALLEEYALGGIYSSNFYTDLYDTLQDDLVKYREAVENNDLKAINAIAEKFTRLESGSQYTLNKEQNYAIKDIFNGLFEEVLNNNKVNAKALISEDTKKQKLWSDLFGKYNETELKQATLSMDYNATFNIIKREADALGISVDDLIGIMKELGIVQEDLTIKTEKATPFKTLVEQVEETQKALTNFDNAISKMSSSDESSAFLTADELNTLIEYDSTLIDEVEKTAKGYVVSTDKLVEARKNYFKNERETLEAEITESEDKIEEYKETLELLEKQRNDSNKTEIDKKVKNVSDQIATLEKNVKNYKLVLSELQAPLIDFRSSLSSITSKAESLTSSITEMSSQQRQFGYVTDKTAASFIASNDNWQDFIELADNGKYILKENADGYKDLIAKSTGYNNVLSALEIQQDELNKQTLYLKGSIIGLSKTGQVGADDIGKLKTQLEENETALSETSVQVETLKMVLEALDRAMKSSEGLNKFNDRIKELKYQLDMGLISQAQYNASYDSALAKFSSVATKEDEDSVRDAEVTSRQQHIQQATTDFEKAENALNTAYEQGNISLQEKLEQRKKLIEQYYGAGTLLGGTEEGRQKYQELLNDLYNMEVEIAKKSYDDRKKLIERNREDNIYNIDQEIEELKKLNEEYYNPETGILGKTREAVDDKIYEENLREIESKSKEAYDYWIAEAERARKMGIITEQQLWDEKLRLANKYLKNIKQFEDEYRDAMDDYAIAGQQAMYDEELRLLENSHSLKLKTDKQYWTERHALAEKYYKNNAAFEKEWMAEQTAYQTEGMRAMYEEDLKESERAYKRGDILLSTHIQNRKNLWETYYKGKAELREEDLQAQEEIKDLYTNGLQGQISALEAFKSAETQQLNDEIELLREEQSERERIAQEQEKVIDKQIRALQRQQEAIERKKKVEEEDYELQKAILNLQKASMGTRLVYTSGGWTLKRDEQKYQDALKEVDEKKQDAQNKQLEKQIEALQSQKQAISDAISDITDKIDEEIMERELAIRKLEAPFDNLIKILTTVATKMTMENIDPALLNMILSSESGQEAMQYYQQTMEKWEKEAAERDKIGVKSTKDYYDTYKIVPKKSQVLNYSNPDYANITRAVFAATKDTNTYSNTLKLLKSFQVELDKQNMTYEELQKWFSKLAQSENMTSEQWAKKYGLADLFGIDTTAGGKNIEQLFGGEDQWERKENTPEKLGQLLTEAADDITNAADEIAEEENMQSVTDGVTATATNTSEILKIIQSFNSANPHLFTGTQGSKVSTTEGVKQDATQIIENVSNTATFNINVEGNADTKTLTAMRTELGKAFNEYTEALTGALSIAHQRQLTT